MSKIPRKLEWLVIIYDKPFCQRLKFRLEHLSKVPDAVKLGRIVSAGPIFKDETQKEFLGSSFVILAETKSEVLELLKSDIYAKESVWDFSNVIIHPYAPFVRVRKDMPE